MTKTPILIAALSLALSLLLANEVLAARAIKVRVELDGVVLLEGSHSDDGRSDADEVWRSYARSSAARARWAGLSETHRFSEGVLRSLSPDKEQFTLKGPRGKNLTVSVLYGGTVEVRELALHRVVAQQGPEEAGSKSASASPIWYVDAKQLDALFEERMITRRQAAELKNAKKLEE